MAEYRKGAHTVYDLKYHIVWAAKDRYHVLKGEIGVRARDIIREVCMSNDIIIIKGHVSVDAATRISEFAEAVLGAALVGAWLFLCAVGDGDG